jgi:hypothetical protein
MLDQFYPLIEYFRRIDVSGPGGVFTVCTLLVLPAWGLLVVAPGWRWSASLIAPVIVPALLAAAYAYLLATNFDRSAMSFGSLMSLERAFQNPALLVAGWLHYLALDLFVGSWEVRDSRRNGIRHLLVVPCLGLTLLFGPLGLAAYLFVRAMQTQRIPLEFTSGASRRRYTGDW